MTAKPQVQPTRTGTEGRAEVIGRSLVATNIVELSLMPTRSLSSIDPGSHIDVAVPLADGDAIRSYSLVDLDDTDGRLRIAVRLDEEGRGGSRWMHSLQPGAVVEISGPHSEFTPNEGRARSVLLAGGIGINPIIGLAKALRDRGAEYRIEYGGRARTRMAYVDHLVHSHPGRVSIFESECGVRVDPVKVVAGMGAQDVLYVCGPLSLLTSARKAWEEAGNPASNLRFETFGTSGVLPVTNFRVNIPSRGLMLDVPVGTTLLHVLEEAGIEILHDCMRGECGLCRVKILSSEGPVDHRDVFLSARQQAENTTMCACVSRGAKSVITLEC